MPLDPFDLLVPVDPALALLRASGHALGIDDCSGRFGILAETPPGLRCQPGRRFGPDAITLEPIPIATHRLPGAKFLRYRPPPAPLGRQLGRQIEAAIDDLPDVMEHRPVR